MSVTGETMGLAATKQRVVLQRAGDRQEQAAVQLLSDYRQGLWLRRFAADQQPCNRPWIIHPEHDRPVIDLRSDQPGICWNTVSHLVTNPSSWVYRASGVEIAVLQFAASLVGTSANLQSITRTIAFSLQFCDLPGDGEAEEASELLQRALREAVAFGTG
ncbi:hypothetical protein [Streptomyces parvus]|uniref:hypothetical protein n=1 Tax=Streptomyces parvus TaxID=66428 RepID=UPI0033CD673B